MLEDTGTGAWNDKTPSWIIGRPLIIDAVHENMHRVDRLTDQIRQLVPSWQLSPVVAALQSARGVSLIVAVTILAEIGDLGRFANPDQLMAYLGLVPSEHSSGEKTKRGAITKTGNSHARKVLIEAAWAYRMQPRVSRLLLKRQQGLSDQVRQISWKAQLRLCTRFRRMVARGKPKPVVVTAIARELSAFLWAITKQVQTAV